jgi:hypothetical protein
MNEDFEKMDSVKLLRERIEKILELTYERSKDGDVSFAAINSVADDCIKLLDYVENK